jgi:hypothetical protein
VVRSAYAFVLDTTYCARAQEKSLGEVKSKSKSEFKYIYGIKSNPIQPNPTPIKNVKAMRPSVARPIQSRSPHALNIAFVFMSMSFFILVIFPPSGTNPSSPIIKKPTRPLRLTLVILLQAANDRQDGSILHRSASTAERLRDARPNPTAKRKRRAGP